MKPQKNADFNAKQFVTGALVIAALIIVVAFVFIAWDVVLNWLKAHEYFSYAVMASVVFLYLYFQKRRQDEIKNSD